jgi:hypothetical protein
MALFGNFLRGLFPTCVAVLTSYTVAWRGYHNLYYMGQLLPAFMVLYVLLAWFAYLRGFTSFLARDNSRGKPSTALLGHHHPDRGCEFPGDKSRGRELKEVILLQEANSLAAREDGRQYNDTGGDLEKSRAPSYYRKLISVLLWSALQLAILATALYHLFGIGARFY